MKNPGWDQMQNCFDITDYQSVTGIVPALEAHYSSGVFSQPVDDLAFAFVTPLGSDYHNVTCHFCSNTKGVIDRASARARCNDPFSSAKYQLFLATEFVLVVLVSWQIDDHNFACVAK